MKAFKKMNSVLSVLITQIFSVISYLGIAENEVSADERIDEEKENHLGLTFNSFCETDISSDALNGL